MTWKENQKKVSGLRIDDTILDLYSFSYLCKRKVIVTEVRKGKIVIDDDKNNCQNEGWRRHHEVRKRLHHIQMRNLGCHST
jgi:hypothetical protein